MHGFVFTLFLATMASAAVSACSSSTTINPSLLSNLKAGRKANIMVSMKEGTSKVLDELNQTTFATREERLNAVGSRLQAHAARTQQKVLAFLSTVSGLKYESLWISNQLSIKDVDLAFVEKLAEQEGISEINEEQIAHILEKDKEMGLM